MSSHVANAIMLQGEHPATWPWGEGDAQLPWRAPESPPDPVIAPDLLAVDEAGTWLATTEALGLWRAGRDGAAVRRVDLQGPMDAAAGFGIGRVVAVAAGGQHAAVVFIEHEGPKGLTRWLLHVAAGSSPSAPVKLTWPRSGDMPNTMEVAAGYVCVRTAASTMVFRPTGRLARRWPCNGVMLEVGLLVEGEPPHLLSGAASDPVVLNASPAPVQGRWISGDGHRSVLAYGGREAPGPEDEGAGAVVWCEVVEVDPESRCLLHTGRVRVPMAASSLTGDVEASGGGAAPARAAFILGTFTFGPDGAVYALEHAPDGCRLWRWPCQPRHPRPRTGS